MEWIKMEDEEEKKIVQMRWIEEIIYCTKGWSVWICVVCLFFRRIEFISEIDSWEVKNIEYWMPVPKPPIDK